MYYPNHDSNPWVPPKLTFFFFTPNALQRAHDPIISHHLISNEDASNLLCSSVSIG